jgi:HAE1 family hydrophobic/amphiphilic exporter-1
MIFVAAVVFGLVSLDRLDLKLLPEISYPSLTIQTEYPDAAPLEVENFVTRPLEEAVGVVPGVRHLTSTSKPGLSEISLEFAWDSRMDYSALDVREKIDLVELPRECKQPVILRYDPSLDPIMRLGVFGDENLVRLRYIADRTVKKELESLVGVASAKVLGGLEEEIQVELDEQKLASLGIPINDVSLRLLQDNINQSGGKLRDRGSEFLLRTENEFKDIEDIRNTIVTQQEGRKIVLADLGSIQRGYREREVITRINGKEAVEVAIYKEGDANTVEVAERVQSRLKSLKEDLPENAGIEVLFDQARFIQQAINEVLFNAILGAILAVIVLYLFLRDARSTFIIGLSIPISVLATFVMMMQLGVSLNLMSLGGLALGVGMLVDNSIVVLESISRHTERGLERKEATYQGASDVGKAVIASTLTSVAVFLPIVFVEGVAGQVFNDQALTVSISLLASLMVALMLIPMISALRLRLVSDPEENLVQDRTEPKKKRRVIGWMGRMWRGATRGTFIFLFRTMIGAFRVVRAAGSLFFRPFLHVFGRAFDVTETRYLPLLDWALRRRGVFLTGAFVFFIATILMGRYLGSELIPQFSQGEFSFNVRLPEGSPLESTDSKLREMEEIAEGFDEVGTYFTTVGLASRLGSNKKNKDKNIGQLNVVMANRGGKKGEARLIEHMRSRYARIEGAESKFARPMYFTLQTPIEVEIYGYNLEKLQATAEQIEREMAKIQGIKDIKSTMEIGNPELNVTFDRERLSSLGLSLDEVSNLLKTKIQGEVPTRFKEKEIQVDIRVRTSAWRAEDIGEVASLVVGDRGGTPITLSTVADIELTRGFSQITRISQQRAAVVSGNITGRDLGSISNDIQAMIDGMVLPQGVTVELAGQNEELGRSFRSLVFALLLAVFLVYLVMAMQFESFIHPLIILFTVPLGAIGVVWTLLITGKSLSVVVFIGIIMLSGIVVNNGIVLIDYINKLRRRGIGKIEALREAGKVRLRPILMTMMTTVLGLLPMALGLGEGAEIRTPMALTVIGGLLGATFLTLLVIPALYAVVDRKD